MFVSNILSTIPNLKSHIIWDQNYEMDHTWGTWLIHSQKTTIETTVSNFETSLQIILSWACTILYHGGQTFIYKAIALLAYN